MVALRGYMAESGLAEGMFRLAVEACPSGMLMVDDAGKIVMVNGEIEHQFGYRHKELIGQPIELLVPMRLRNKRLRHREDFIPHPETARWALAAISLGGGKMDRSFLSKLA
jgi:PAS domain-containing protein